MERKTLALVGVCALVAGIVGCSSSKPATPVAPTNTGVTVGPDGVSTLKVTPATIQSPTNDQRLLTDVVVLTAGPATPQFASGLALQYRFQVLTSANTVAHEALVNGPTAQVATTTLLPNTRYAWRVRPEFQGEVGPWSGTGSFVTRLPFLIDDPLTNGRTVGSPVGGRFIPGEGWQSGGLTDGINYDVPTGCIDCTLEFDATNFGGQEGLPFEKDLKWVSMGDPGAFVNFGGFRDHPWKMHLVQRADYPSGMEIIWRNGGTDASGGDPGDHRIKLTSTPIDFRSTNVYHFKLDWGIFGYEISVNGIEVLSDDWDHWYELAPLRIQLGCIPRGESFVGIIYRNVTLKKDSDVKN
jgi:hypothetical protein